ncbi:MAG: phospholipase D family protein [Candidatus Thiodiazotropha sp.]
MNTQDTALGRAFLAHNNSDPQQSGFLLLGSGLDAFAARAVLARAAERSIDAQYYLLHDDMTGTLFIDELLKAAERGVRVRLLVDDMDLSGRELSAAALDAHENFEVRIFNPFGRERWRITELLSRFGEITRRMHNKSFTVDNQATVVGGRNIGDEYFEANPALAFGDLDVLGFGPIAREVSDSFDEYWNHSLAYPASRLVEQLPDSKTIAARRKRHDEHVAELSGSDYMSALRRSKLLEQLKQGTQVMHWGRAEVVADDPDKLISGRDRTDLRLTHKLSRHFEGLSQELIIFSPYFVPGEEGVALFTKLIDQGVRVRILTNSLAATDVAVVHAGYARYRSDLLRAGVELYEMNRQVSGESHSGRNYLSGSSKASLHAKSFVLDQKKVFIGSLNLDPRSVVENSEIGVVIDASEIAQSMSEWFDGNVHKLAFRLSLETDDQGREQLQWRGYEEGNPVTFDSEPHTSVWLRMMVRLLGFLPVEDQL